MKFRALILFLLIISLIACNKKNNASENPKKKVVKDSSKIENLNYKKIAATESGIHFKNNIKHNLSTKQNLFDFDFFYNGAGVGTEDLNNDGLLDIVFTSNQGANKLYINKGNLVFEDITPTANINTNKHWSNGVTFVDINNDGWMDIYISQGGPHDKSKRNNLLYINQKNLTFIEQAAKYGLDDHGISTQTAFFDYDKDGDLDCFVSNENDYYGVDPIRFYKILSNTKKLKENAGHLYKNTNNKFVDVTQKAGILKPSFGLGLCVSDINNDGWLDIYTTNDYYVPDAMYINNKNGTFTDQIKSATKQITFYGMGVDIADINNDNLKDIFVLDMASSNHIRSKTLMASMNVKQNNLLVHTLGLQTQYMYNSLQLNLDNNKFHNISQLTGLSKTDWSWAGLIFDADNDGDNDIYVSNGYRRYALDNDIKRKILITKNKYKGNVPLEVKEKIYNALPSEKLSNILFQNNGNLNFKNTTATSGISEPSFSNGAVYADLDNDGDLDILVNNMDDEAFLYKNLSMEQNKGNFIKIISKGNTSEDFAKVILKYNGKTRTKESKRVRGYLSSVDKNIHFGLGKNTKIDTLKIIWTSGKSEERYNVKANATITFFEKNAKIDQQKSLGKEKLLFQKNNELLTFHHKENIYNDFGKEILLPYKQSTLGPFITVGDINNDRKEDLYIGGAKEQAGQLYLQTNTGFKKMNTPIFESDSGYEDMEALFIDIDNDGDQDLYVVSGGSEFNERSEYLKDRIYLNDGKGHFSNYTTQEIKDYTISGKTITKIDFDKDGDLDIIVGNRIKPQKYPLHDPSIIYENVNGIFKNVTKKIAPQFEDFGMVNKIIATDFNNDGWEDFIVVGEWTHIGIFLNDKGTFKDVSKDSNLDQLKGWWFSIVETDINNDGNKDYLIGNVGKNIKFKVSNNKPLRVYATDFDANGTHDVVLSYKFNGEFVPARGKECSTQQMPFISKKIPTYNEFAHSSLEKIYGEKIYTAYQREANQFKSIVLLNKGNGKFDIIELPIMAQTMPILDSDTYDFNHDGFEDLVIVGNMYNTEVETPKLDNPYALILLSNQKNNYIVLNPNKTGLYIHGNAKSVKIVKHKKRNKVFAIITINNGKTETFELNEAYFSR